MPARPRLTSNLPHSEEPGVPPGVSKDAPSRRYGGIALEDRKAERRDRLIRAAVMVAARLGRDGASVAAICAEAGLTARYFYESFQNRDELFIAAFRHVQDELFSRMQPPGNARDPIGAALVSFFTALATHPGAARVFLLDLDRHDPAMKALGREADRKLGALIAPNAPATAASGLLRAGVTGAIVEIARRWIESDFAEKPEAVAALALRFARVAEPK